MTDPARRQVLDALASLLDVVDRLRAPEGGCPWDLEQTERSMAPHLLEEAFEAVEAIETGDARSAVEELGDVLMNVLMIARIGSEAGRFDLAEIATGIADKLIRRHPHVFGELQLDDADAVLANWEQIKRRERGDKPRGTLDGVPRNLPALLRGYRVGQKVARVGFDWPDARGPRAKVEEELTELDEALATGDRAAAEHELGDVLFSLCNLARHHDLDPEACLRAAVGRFSARFAYVEHELGDGLAEAPMELLEAAWQRAKRAEYNAAGDGG